MKSCDAGKASRSRPRPVPCLLPLIGMALVWGFDARAVIERRGWLIEQWETPPTFPNAPRKSRTQVSLGVVNYGDALSTQAAGLLDLGAVEIGVKASGRAFLALTDEGRFLAGALSDERQTGGVTLARHFTTEDGHYGRLGVGLLHSLPAGTNWIHLDLGGGVLESPALPWSFSLETNLFLSYPRSSSFLSVRAASARSYSLGEKTFFELGGFLWWTYRLRALAVPPGMADMTFEHMLFSLGPSCALRGAFGVLRADLLFRLWLDEEITGSGSSALTGYPSEFGPSLQLTYTYFL